MSLNFSISPVSSLPRTFGRLAGTCDEGWSGLVHVSFDVALYAVAAQLFGVVESDIGAGEDEGQRELRGERNDGDADTEGDLAGTGGELESVNGLADLVTEAAGGCLIEAGKEDGELIASVPAAVAAGVLGGGFLEDDGDLKQDLIAVKVAVLVVGLLETVGIGKDEGEGDEGGVVMGESLEGGIEGAAIADLGERVPVGKEGELLVAGEEVEALVEGELLRDDETGGVEDHGGDEASHREALSTTCEQDAHHDVAGGEEGWEKAADEQAWGAAQGERRRRTRAAGDEDEVTGDDQGERGSGDAPGALLLLMEPVDPDDVREEHVDEAADDDEGDEAQAAAVFLVFRGPGGDTCKRAEKAGDDLGDVEVVDGGKGCIARGVADREAEAGEEEGLGDVERAQNGNGVEGEGDADEEEGFADVEAPDRARDEVELRQVVKVTGGIGEVAEQADADRAGEQEPAAPSVVGDTAQDEDGAEGEEDLRGGGAKVVGDDCVGGSIAERMEVRGEDKQAKDAGGEKEPAAGRGGWLRGEESAGDDGKRQGR